MSSFSSVPAPVATASTRSPRAARSAFAAFALDQPPSYFQELASHYQARRDRVVAMLERAGLRCSMPRGAYYVMTDITGLGWSDDVAFVRHLVEDIGVAAVPGSSFYRTPATHAIDRCTWSRRSTTRT